MRQGEALGGGRFHHAERVVCSPLRRARQTAEAFGLPVTVDERWAEIDYGVYDGMPLDEVPASLWREWDHDLGWTPEGGESLAGVAARVRDACDDLWAEAATSDVVVVSHVSPIKAAICWALGVPDETIWRMFVAVASVSRIGAGRAGAPTLHSYSETAHRPQH